MMFGILASRISFRCFNIDFRFSLSFCGGGTSPNFPDRSTISPLRFFFDNSLSILRESIVVAAGCFTQTCWANALGLKDLPQISHLILSLMAAFDSCRRSIADIGRLWLCSVTTIYPSLPSMPSTYFAGLSENMVVEPVRPSPDGDRWVYYCGRIPSLLVRHSLAWRQPLCLAKCPRRFWFHQILSGAWLRCLRSSNAHPLHKCSVEILDLLSC